MKPLTPPDLKRCQAEVPTGYSFLTLGGRPGRERCENKARMIATEIKAGEDGRIGAMSLCDRCFAVFQEQQPTGLVIFERIP